MKYLFGPVNSRRLGISLGVDLVTYKTCSLSCVYCECGETTELTSKRAEYVPTDDVISELDRYLSGSPTIDFVTFSGSGEPTLHSGIGRIITHIRENHPRYSIAVLTNGTLFSDPVVRRDVAGADIVIPSLDAVSPEVFDRICRPAAGITSDKLIEGLAAFRREFSGKIFLEIFIVPGVNDVKEELLLLRQACLDIRPDRVQINSLDRPGTVDWVEPAEKGLLHSIADFFRPLEVEIIGRPASRAGAGPNADNLVKSIISILRRRPSTIDDLLAALGPDRSALELALDSMIASGMVTVEKLERGDFYRMV
ncbi:MAG: radical SAM protein [Spirochaetes bacterium]|nr:radical SAM protein [Spirochaetota bacterium]